MKAEALRRSRIDILLLSCALTGLTGCGPDLDRTGGVDARIGAVEGGLTTLVQIRGREPERFTLSERMEHYQVPGVSVAVIEDGQVDWARGYGLADVETREPVTTETLFQAASISKPVAAMAALSLVDAGVLELDAPVNQYLRDWTLPENDFTSERPVTLRHLLTHTGGLTVHGFPGYAVTDDVATTVQVLDGSGPANTDPIRVDTIPGSLWRYSGGGYTIMQKLLEDVTGKPFPVVLRERVLDPVGMTLSSYEQPLPVVREAGAASGHLRDGTRVEGEWHIYPEMAAAGLWTTPTELAQLALEVQASLRGQSNRVLSQSMTEQMLERGMGGYGLGFGINEEGATRFAHGGSNHGFKAYFSAFVSEGRGIMVMTNGDRGSILAQEIIQSVAREYAWDIPGPREIEVATLSPEMLDRVEGTYSIPGVDLDVVITVEEDHLYLEVADGSSERYFPLDDTRFINLEAGEEFSLVLSGDGRVTALDLGRGLRAERAEGR